MEPLQEFVKVNLIKKPDVLKRHQGRRVGSSSVLHVGDVGAIPSDKPSSDLTIMSYHGPCQKSLRNAHALIC